MSGCPVLGICGYSGSGKTTVIEALLARLCGSGLKVGVIKHDTHGLQIDREGKDTDRIFKAGGDVLIRGPDQVFLRVHRRCDESLEEAVRLMAPYFDLLLLEGHKTSRVAAKVWLCGESGDPPPAESGPVLRVLRRDEDRVGNLMGLIAEWLPATWRACPVYGGVLIGGRSERMGGQPKHLIVEGGLTWAELAVNALRGCVDRVVLLGKGEVPAALRDLPVLCDVEDAQGPVRGLLAAMRWAPEVGWLFAPCDVPWFSEQAARWLLEQRRPGVWAILPRLPGARHVEPLPGYYDSRAARSLARVAGPSEMASEPTTLSPEIPADLVEAWRNVNEKS